MFSIIHSHQKIERQSLSLQPARAQAQCLSLVTMAWWEFSGISSENMMGTCDFPPSVRKITINIWMGWDITNHNHGFCGIYFGFYGWWLSVSNPEIHWFLIGYHRPYAWKTYDHQMGMDGDITIMGYVMGNLKLGCRFWEYTRYTIPPTDAMSWSSVFFAGCTMVMWTIIPCLG